MQNIFYEFGEGSSKLLLLIQDGTNTVKVNSDGVSLHFNSWKKRNDAAICCYVPSIYQCVRRLKQ